MICNYILTSKAGKLSGLMVYLPLSLCPCSYSSLQSHAGIASAIFNSKIKLTTNPYFCMHLLSLVYSMKQDQVHNPLNM